MASLDTVIQVVEVVKQAVEIYNRIKDAPDTIRTLGRRMKSLKSILENLKEHLQSNKKHALARLKPAQTKDLLRVIGDTSEDCDKVLTIFDKWEKKIGPLGLPFRDNPLALFVAQAYLALGSPAKELEDLASKIDAYRSEIDTYLGLMTVQGAQANRDILQDIVKGMNKNQKDIDKKLKQLDQLIKAGNQALLQPPPAPPASQPKKNKADAEKKRPRPSPSPSPSPPRKDLKIIFIDHHNLGRSICAEALTLLYAHWTTMSGGDWRIKTVNSAGFFTRNKSGYADVIEKLDYKFKSYKLKMSAGGEHPDNTPFEAVFENKTFEQDPLFKKGLKEQIYQRKSRGLGKGVFNNYDYILVFTAREHDNMVNLRSSLLASEGDKAFAKDKGRVVHLGRYLNRDGSVEEIFEPLKNKDGVQAREEWNKKVSQIKMAIRRFLEKEMDWKQPETPKKS